MEELIKMLPKKYSKLSKTWRELKLTTLNWCTNQVIISILTWIFRFGLLSSFYLKLMNGDIDIDVAKLNMEELKEKR